MNTFSSSEPNGESAVQLDLFEQDRARQESAARNERLAELAQQIERQSRRRLDVTWHRNRWVYFSCCPNRRDRRLRVRLHEAFADAPSDVIEALATLIRSDDRQAHRVVSSFVDVQSQIWDERADRPPRPPKIVTRGVIYDLQAIFDELNQRYFDGQCGARITWGNHVRQRRRRRQIVFGTYDGTTGIIRIHPFLDRRRVPKYFVRYIVYHEMLHSALPATLSPTGRCVFHTRLFRQRERLFDDFERARGWERRFIGET